MPLCLCLFAGIPASGKTSTARRISSMSRDLSVHHLSYDDFVKPGTCYKTFRMEMLWRIEEFIEKFQKLEYPSVLIVDDIMTYSSMRKEVYSLARKHKTGYFQVYFRISQEKALERNRSRPNAVPDATIANLSLKIEPPSQDTNLETLTIEENQSLDFNEFREKVLYHLANPEEPPEPPKEKEKVEPSKLHKIDLILRQEISRRIREAPDRETIKRLSETLNSRRKNILKGFRESSRIPESVDEVRNLLYKEFL
ncbi:L-seryl-tRNA(Sec) kinase [Phlebotomus papatasi]|uniref:L-seryl-tRNA(Sec) kinase n=1 Tax=Phlebotomus papatasi TaxID=29031 RepID=UPI00248467AB|nr:L-seryl-tRNA(Sec) kinase [Phlebotomus papatasi]